MIIAVTGASGQLGTDLCRTIQGSQVVPLTHAEIELADIASVKKALCQHTPDVVVNTAAYVAVDDAETERERAFLINALGVRNIAVVCQEIGAKLVHISTDYVFGGESRPRATPYTEFDDPTPLNVYGRSKLAGEAMLRQSCLRHFIVRTSALFGTAGASGKGGNFVETILARARAGEELRVVHDQTSTPTYTPDLARKLVQLLVTEYYGTFHITNGGSCTWYEFAREILRLAGLEARLVPVTSAQYPRPAQRPRFSVLDNFHLRLLGLDDMRPWPEALRDYLTARGQDPVSKK